MTEIESLVDFVTAHPDDLPKGWTMLNDQALADPEECIVLYELERRRREA